MVPGALELWGTKIAAISPAALRQIIQRDVAQVDLVVGAKQQGPMVVGVLDVSHDEQLLACIERGDPRFGAFGQVANPADENRAEWPAFQRPFASKRFEPITAEADDSFGYAKAAT